MSDQEYKDICHRVVDELSGISKVAYVYNNKGTVYSVRHGVSHLIEGTRAKNLQLRELSTAHTAWTIYHVFYAILPLRMGLMQAIIIYSQVYMYFFRDAII